MAYFGVSKEQAEQCIAETPLHAADTSDVESEKFLSESEEDQWVWEDWCSFSLIFLYISSYIPGVLFK